MRGTERDKEVDVKRLKTKSLFAFELPGPMQSQNYPLFYLDEKPCVSIGHRLYSEHCRKTIKKKVVIFCTYNAYLFLFIFN